MSLTDQSNPRPAGQTLLPLAIDAWDRDFAAGLSGRDEALYRSHLLGGDSALTREGGGNFSAKGLARDHRGEQTRVLWMSSWGCDGASTTEEDFPALRLDDLNLLRDSAPLSEQVLLDYELACELTGRQRPPGIETMTHAFLPFTHVDHLHPESVVVLTDVPGGRDLAADEFGPEAIWFDYRQFDLGVAQELSDRIAAEPRCRFVLLANHGTFTWADTSEQCYRNSLELVQRANRALSKAFRGRRGLGGGAARPLPRAEADSVLTALLPALRGGLSQDTQGVVMHLDRSERAVQFASSVQGPALSQLGPGCPDHLGTVGYRPMLLAAPQPGAPQAALDDLREALARHRQWYQDYYESNVPERMRPFARGTDAPRAVVVPGIGIVTAGTDGSRAQLAADHFDQTMMIIEAADACGGYTSITEQQGALDEYWPMIRLKPQLQPPTGPLAGRIFLVAGQDRERAATVAEGLVIADAHVMIAGPAGAAAGEIAQRLCHRYGRRRVVAGDTGDDPQAAVQSAVLTFGGFDGVVDLGPEGGLIEICVPVLARQGLGGSVLLANLGWSADRLRGAVDRWEPELARHGVAVGAVAEASAVAVAELAAFLTTSVATSNTWKGTVLEPGPRLIEKVMIK